VFATLKTVLKRGALLAASNWQVTFIQTVADSLFKLLIAVPLLGGILLVSLIVGAEPGALLTLSWGDLVPALVSALLSRPLVLASFLAALGVVLAGGSLFLFLVKGGTVAILARAEREAGPVEQRPLQLDTLVAGARFSVERFVESARSLFPRYARLGVALMAVYLSSGAVYLITVFASRAGAWWGTTALVTVAFAAWITVVNLLYLLMQVVIAADDCSVTSAAGRVTGFLRHQYLHVLFVFVVVLVMAILATGASLLATALLGLIAFVPFFGLTVLPLQLLAWLLRGVVFQYIGLTSIGAYLTLYRSYSAALAAGRLPVGAGQSATGVPPETTRVRARQA
jgi:hypothetical protein